MWWHLLAGYGVSVVLGFFVIKQLSHALWRGIGWKPQPDAPHVHVRPHPEHPAMVGVLERVLYTAAWQLGHPEFAAAWLVLKVAGNWSGWATTRDPKGRYPMGREIFNVFLIGNGFSLLFGFVGGLVIDWLAAGHDLRALVAVGAVTSLGLFFIAWTIRTPKSELAPPAENQTP